MAIVPQFDAGAPGGIPTPTRAPERSRRTAAGELQGLGDLAGSLRNIGQAGQTPQFSADFGQAGLRGLANVGRAIEQVGGIWQELETKKQEAKDYADTVQSQDALNRVAGEFEAFKAQNPNPEKWEEKWGEMYGQVRERYFSENESLSPQAQQAIQLRMESFGNTVATETKVEAVKQQFQRARESGFAEYAMAKEAGDEAGGVAVVQYMAENYWIGPDDTAAMMIDLSNAARAKNNERVRLSVDTALMQDDVETALELANGYQFDIVEQHANEMTRIRTVSGTRAELSRIEELAFEDPVGAQKEIEASDILGAADKYKLKTLAGKLENEEYAAIAQGVVERLRQEATKDFEEDEEFSALPAAFQDKLKAAINEGIVNDVGEFASMRAKILGFDPETDPRGAMTSMIQTEIAARFEGDPAKELATLLQERSQTAPTPSQKAISEVFSMIDEDHRSGKLGGYRVTRGDVTSADVDGKTVYGVKDNDAPEDQSFKKGFSRYRIIEISEDDRLKVDDYKTPSNEVLTDLNAKRTAGTKKAYVLEKLDNAVRAGELQTFEEMAELVSTEYSSDFLNLTEETTFTGDLVIPGGIQRIRESDLFPDGPDTAIKVLEEFEKQINAGN